MFQTTLKKILLPRKTHYCWASKKYFHGAEDAYSRQPFFKRSFTKPFTIMSENSVLGINCVKGRFKQQQDYIAIEKTGIITLDFIPLKKAGHDKKQHFDPIAKKKFSLNLKSVGQILNCNPHELKNGSLKLEFKYYAGSQNEDKKLTIQKNIKEDKIIFTLTTQMKGNNSSFTIPVDLGEFIIIQELIKYSLPFMLGWHVMSSPRIAEEEFSSNGQAEVDI